MTIVGRGYGQPPSGAIVATGLGITEPATLEAVCSATASIVCELDGGLPVGGTRPPGGIEVAPMPLHIGDLDPAPLVATGMMTAALSGGAPLGVDPARFLNIEALDVRPADAEALIALGVL